MTYSTFIDILEKLLIPIIIGIITFIIAKRQITNTGVTQFRQQWINDLRNTISSFMAKVEYVTIQRDTLKSKEAYSEMQEARFKIELLLNPNENDHQEIVDKVDHIQIIASLKDTDTDALEILTDELLEISKRVLKREWNVVKSGR